MYTLLYAALKNMGDFLIYDRSKALLRKHKGMQNYLELHSRRESLDSRLDEVKGRQRYAMEHIRSLGAVVEVCPSSNRRIGGLKEPFHHPVQQFISNGVPFVVSTDDPGVLDTTLADEIDWVIRAADLGPCSFDEIAERSWSYRSEVLVGREST